MLSTTIRNVSLGDEDIWKKFPQCTSVKSFHLNTTVFEGNAKVKKSLTIKNKGINIFNVKLCALCDFKH